MGFFYAMNYTTKTTLDGDYAVIKVYQDGEFWHEYEFPLKDWDNFVEHISFKVWGTVGNLKEIQTVVQHGKR